MKTEYSIEVRVVICEGCGAPVSCERGGTSGSCRYCGAAWHTGAETRALERLSFGTEAMSEHERIARLSASVGAVRTPSAGMLAFMDDAGAIRPEQIGAATVYWWMLRRRLEQTRSMADADALHLFTLLLANHFGATRDRLRHRGMLESALETLRGCPRLEQRVLTDLARNAIACGDLPAAEAWLGRCDPRPDDLGADSAFRYAAAMLAIVRGDAASALQYLGGYPSALPISSEYDVVTAVTRAHALEATGQLPAAEAELRGIAARSAAVVRKVLANSTAYVPCPRTLAALRASVPERSVGGCALFVLGSVFMLGAAGMVSVDLIDLGGGMGGMGYVLGAIFLLVALIFMPLSWHFASLDRPRKRARRRGRRLPAVVEGIEATGTSVGRCPFHQIAVRVEPVGAAPYAATIGMLLAPEESIAFHAGARILVWSDPAEPEAAALDTGAVGTG